MPHSSGALSPRHHNNYGRFSSTLRFVLLIGGLSLIGAPSIAKNDRVDISQSRERALVDIYRLNSSGQETPQSLKSIRWRSSNDSVLLRASDAYSEHWFPLLAVTVADNAPLESTSLALGRVAPNGTRMAAVGANPIHDLLRPHKTGARANARAEAWLEHTIAWLVDRENPFAPVDAPSLNILLMGLNGLSAKSTDELTPQWFEARGQHVRVTPDKQCKQRVSACINDSDLLVLGPGDASSEWIASAVGTAERNGTPILYLHEGPVHAPHTAEALGALGLQAHSPRKVVNVARASGRRLWREQ